MKAVVLTEFGAPLRLREIGAPEARPGQVLVRVKASGVNPLDLKISAGQAAHARAELPAVLGMDLSGVVQRVGDGVTGFVVGDEVYGLTGGVGGLPGSLAELVAVDAKLLAVKPRSLDHRSAAALPLVGITAWEGLIDRARTWPGQRVLVHGGAGGVGYAAIQLARARGADVFATSSARHLAAIEELGATAIDRTVPVAEYVAEHTGGEGFDVVYDTVGGPVLDASFTAVREHTGHVVSALGWGTHALAPLSFRGATYSGVFTLLPMLTGRGRAHHGAIARKLAALVDGDRLRPRVDPHRFTLETVAEAHELVAGGRAEGKVVVDVG